jgi:uncharacterized membrane protein YqjE
MNDATQSKPGVWASLHKVLDSALATVENRVELFAVEVQEEKCRLVEALLCAAAVGAFGMMGLTLLTFTVVTLFWENGRTYALVGLTVAYLIAAGLAWRGLQLRLRSRSAFSGTLDELRKDRSCLRPDP